MARIKIEDIQKASAEHGWRVISTEYKNLQSLLIFECDKGHRFEAPWSRVRDRWICPICRAGEFTRKIDTVKKPVGVTRVLGLDQATHITGWSVFDDGQLTTFGLHDVEGEEEIERLVDMRNWLISMIKAYRPDMVVMEGIQYQTFQGVVVFQTLARLQGALLVTCEENDVPVSIAPTNTWRAYWGVKGKTRQDKKISMMNIIKENYGVSVSNDEADAIGIGGYGTTIVKPRSTKNIKTESWE